MDHNVRPSALSLRSIVTEAPSSFTFRNRIDLKFLQNSPLHKEPVNVSLSTESAFQIYIQFQCLIAYT